MYGQARRAAQGRRRRGYGHSLASTGSAPTFHPQPPQGTVRDPLGRGAAKLGEAVRPSAVWPRRRLVCPQRSPLGPWYEIAIGGESPAGGGGVEEEEDAWRAYAAGRVEASSRRPRLLEDAACRHASRTAVAGCCVRPLRQAAAPRPLGRSSGRSSAVAVAAIPAR